MTTIEQRTTVVGVFNDRAQAEQAMKDLHQAGFSDEQIGFVVHHKQHVEHRLEEPGSAPGTATGAVSGGILGGVAGAAAALLIPGLGPALAGGIIGATLGAAALGAATGSFIGAMTALGLSEEDAHYYQRELETGRVIVTVQPQARAQEAQALLRAAGAVDASIHTERAIVPPPSFDKDERKVDAEPDEPKIEDEPTRIVPHVSASAVNMKAEPTLKPYVPEARQNLLKSVRTDSVVHHETAWDRPNRNNIPLGTGM